MLPQDEALHRAIGLVNEMARNGAIVSEAHAAERVRLARDIAVRYTGGNVSLEAWGDGGDEADPVFDEARVEEAFRDGLRVAREYLARFVEQGGDAQTAGSIRANWNPAWGKDDGSLNGELWIDAWGMTSEMKVRSRERLAAALQEARGGAR